MRHVTRQDLDRLFIAKPGSHKGQNGRLLIIGGSHLFHAASMWALEVASRIVDLVHYSSVPENNDLVMQAKKQFRNGIIVPRSEIDAYITEDDCILIGPGMTRDAQTDELTHKLLTTYPHKQWVIDAGALQMLRLADIPKNAVLTPHHFEFAGLWEKALALHPEFSEAVLDADRVKLFAKQYHCVVLLKGEVDIACSGGDCDARACVPGELWQIDGGNEGMTKGGTGDVLAGLIAALACKNEPILAVIAGSLINKTAGDDLYASVGPFYNASDLASQIPKTLRRLFYP